MAKAAPVSASSSTSTLGPSPRSFLAKQALEHFNPGCPQGPGLARYGEELKKMRRVPTEGGTSGRPLRPRRDFQVHARVR